MIPLPRKVRFGEGNLVLKTQQDTQCDIVVTEDIFSIAKVFALEWYSLTGIRTDITTKLKEVATSNNPVRVILELDHSLEEKQYSLSILEHLILKGGSTQALHWAITTLMQILPPNISENGVITLPKCEIVDECPFPYVGLLVDVARKWHPIPVLREIVLLCRFYKVPFLHIHFTDNQSYTLPSQAYPKLPSKNRHYSEEQLIALDQFARDRGVTIIPEIDLPGHSRTMVYAYPKLFGVKPLRFGKFGKPKSNVVNMGKEEVYTALSRIIQEVCDLFPHAPYFHLGADEVRFSSLERDPDIQQYCATHNLPNVEELYRHFIVRMYEVVQAQGKQMCIWEGFRAGGQVKIPHDIPVFVFESLYNTADQLVGDGYSVVNTSWKPIYVTTRKNWTPEEIYRWNPCRWENWVERSLAYEKPIEIKHGPYLLGAQMCSWEQPAENEIPSLRHRLAAFIDRVWGNTVQNPYSDFHRRLQQLDTRLDELLKSLCC